MFNANLVTNKNISPFTNNTSKHVTKVILFENKENKGKESRVGPLKIYLYFLGILMNINY